MIGSLISQAYHHNDGHSTHRYYHSGNYAGRTESRVVYRTAEPVDYREQESAIPRHILLRDRDGRCFTVTETDAGTELRTEIDAGACERDSQLLHQRLQNDHTRLRNEVLSEFGSKTGKLFNINNKKSATAFSAPGASNADFEEMTFMMQKTMESKLKSLSRRRISASDDIELWGAKGDARQRIADIQKLRQIYGQLDNSYNPGHLQKHAKFLYELAAKGEEFSFTDSSLPAGSYIQLREAEQVALRKNDKVAEKNIKEKLAELDKDERFSRQIDAGLNTAEIFKNAYNDCSDRNRMRAIYYNNILGSVNAAALMHALISIFSEQQLGQNIDRLSKAILADMSAGRPSSSVKHLTTKLGW